MISFKSLALAAALVPCLASGAPPEVVSGNTAFAFDLYAQMRAQAGNLFFSPYSISTALAMTYGGARGDTAAQMSKALHFEVSATELPPAFAALQAGLNDIQAKGKVKLAVANSLWPQKGYDFLPTYLELCKTSYGVNITPVDFAGATESARKAINQWVEDKTNQKITELFKPGVLDSLTRLVLVNAIYFKGDWASQFDKARTRVEPFSVSGDKKVDASMMNAQKKKYRYAETPDLQVVELPYAGNDLSMVILLPRAVDGLPALERLLDAARFGEWTKSLRPCEVVLTLPKFKATSEFSLNQTLSPLGMTDAFSGKADFSGMNGRKDLYISAVVHKAFVDVNEEGTEAAAATGVVISRKSMSIPQKPVVFRADHPFLFFIRENKSGGILFMGRIVNPGVAGAKTVSAN